jgi:hypothetical protein
MPGPCRPGSRERIPQERETGSSDLPGFSDRDAGPSTGETVSARRGWLEEREGSLPREGCGRAAALRQARQNNKDTQSQTISTTAIIEKPAFHVPRQS